VWAPHGAKGGTVTAFVPLRGWQHISNLKDGEAKRPRAVAPQCFNELEKLYVVGMASTY